MALVSCPECKAEISDEAKVCPRCGSKKVAKGWTVGKLIVAGVFVALVGSCIANQVKLQNDPAAAAAAQQRADESMRIVSAQEECKDSVLRRLKAPSSATFPNEIEVRRKKDDPTMFYALGQVDAQNSFGAKLRQQFVCKLRSGTSPSDMTVTDVTIG